MMIYQPFTGTYPRARKAEVSTTQPVSDSSENIATTEFVHNLVSLLDGDGGGTYLPTTTAETQPIADRSVKLATTEFVHNLVESKGYQTSAQVTSAVSSVVSSAISDKATTKYVDGKVSDAVTDMATQTWVGGQISSAVNDMAKQTWTTGQINTATTDMATQTWVSGEISSTDGANREWTSSEIESAVAGHTDAVTQATTDKSTKIATDEFVHNVVDAHTDAITQPVSDNSTKIATTGFIRDVLGSSTIVYRGGFTMSTWYQNTESIPILVVMEVVASVTIHLSATGGSTAFSRGNAIGTFISTVKNGTVTCPLSLIVPPGYWFGYYSGTGFQSSAVHSRVSIGKVTL